MPKKVGLEDLLEKTVEKKSGWREWFKKPDWRNFFRGLALIFLTIVGYVYSLVRKLFR